jgi:CheY-like chemotaxis protein
MKTAFCGSSRPDKESKLAHAFSQGRGVKIKKRSEMSLVARATNTSKSILLIEDDVDIRTILKDALEWEGYRVYTASNGKEGIGILPEIPAPSLILLDLMMPVMNGWEFADALETDRAYADIPIVTVSAFSDPEKRIRAADSIKKPVDLDALFALVRKHCGLGDSHDWADPENFARSR